MSDFLVYSHLHTASDGDAKQLVDTLSNLNKFPVTALAIDTALAAIPARFALELGRWDEPAGMNREALAELEASDKVMPNRFRSVAGAARAARETGSVETTKRHYRALTALSAARGTGRKFPR